MGLREQFEKETGKKAMVDFRRPEPTFDYFQWLEQRLEAGHHDPLVIGFKGELVKMGTMYVDDEKLTGVFVLCDKEEFTKQTGNLLYMDVKVIPQDQ